MSGPVKANDETPRYLGEWRCPHCDWHIAASTDGDEEHRGQVDEWLARRSGVHLEFTHKFHDD